MTKKIISSVKLTKGKRPQTAKPQKAGGAPFSEQDPKRRLGNFSGAGEHPRQGSRSAGIIGQSKKRNRTD